jgi:hypothetical protein
LSLIGGAPQAIDDCGDERDNADGRSQRSRTNLSTEPDDPLIASATRS